MQATHQGIAGERVQRAFLKSSWGTIDIGYVFNVFFSFQVNTRHCKNGSHLASFQLTNFTSPPRATQWKFNRSTSRNSMEYSSLSSYCPKSLVHTSEGLRGTRDPFYRLPCPQSRPSLNSLSPLRNEAGYTTWAHRPCPNSLTWSHIISFPQLFTSSGTSETVI